MSKVGNVTFQSKDYAEGIIRTRTMALNIRVYTAGSKVSDNHPDYDVKELLSDGSEVPIGSAWINTATTGQNIGSKYISMSLDDPSFPMPLNVTLFATAENEHDVVWNRPREKAA
ncbi:DUF736 domain-containing protein [Paremcibacter congregatus]|uniref:DUF736 domain-containing protein n=1 Tax=Paremcibacter congregatus TaxID=2043170 RepID=A0A2G4YT05_9PROT|nr:DUF736 domain-containing protein [Paremcibacter congregatus]PHZ85469.1 hypothetical protein CRD36_06645 [Paremcibacter congregatus]QDE27292.1 DUF736 domain-containing protein [Paremcibacter congregatus]